MNQHSFAFHYFKDENFSLKEEFLRQIQSNFCCQVFVETGTLFGQTSEKAAAIFPEVHTIELSESLYQRAVKFFQSRKNVFIYHGDSGTIFPDLLKKIDGKIAFWLDGHFSGGETARSGKATPIIEELQAIKKSGKTDAVILVDDLRNHDKSLPSVSSNLGFQDYPSLKELYNHIIAINPRYQLAVLGDILLAYNIEERTNTPLVSETVRSCTISRLSDVIPFELTDILRAETRIGKAIGLELELLQNLYKIYRGDERFGFCKHYRLWYALSLLEQKQFSKAYKEFLIAKILGLDHWRIEWYLARAAFGAGDGSLTLEHLSLIKDSHNFQPINDLLDQIHILTPNQFLSLSADDHLDLALHYCFADEFDKAEDRLSQTLSLYPEHSEILTKYAEMLIEFDFLTLAEKQLQKAIQCEPAYSPAYNDLGVLYQHRNDLGCAMEFFSKAFELNNSNYKALRNMILLAKEMGLAREAGNILEEIIYHHGPKKTLLDIRKDLLK